MIVLAYMLGQLGNLLPLPGGVGGVEPVMLGVLTASGVNLGLGGAAIVFYRFISLGLQSGGGAIAVATLIPTLQNARALARHRSPDSVRDRALGQVGEPEREPRRAERARADPGGRQRDLVDPPAARPVRTGPRRSRRRGHRGATGPPPPAAPRAARGSAAASAAGDGRARRAR